MKKLTKLLTVIMLLSVATAMMVACSKKNTVEDDVYLEKAQQTNAPSKKEAEEPRDEKADETPAKEETDETNTPSDVTIKVAALKGPTGMGMAKLMEDIAAGESDLKADFTISGAPDELVGKIVSGEVDFACIPTNLASVLYNKTGGKIQLAAINTLGVLYIMENGEAIQSIEDLKGKTIQASGKGSVPEYALKYLLSKNGIDPEKDVEIDFGMQHAEVAATVISGDTSIALLPQPFVTTTKMKKADVRIALDLTEEWNKVQESPLAMGCIVVNKAFAESNTDLVKSFLEAYEGSINWVNENPVEAGVIIEKQGILPKAKVAELAIPKSHITYMGGSEAKTTLQAFYQILFDFNPASVGGKIPGEDFYY